MRDIQLDDNGGLDFKSVVTDQAEVMQSARIILETKLGEFLEAPELGLDRTDLMEKGFNQRYASQAISEALGQDDRITVQSVSVTADFNTRQAHAELALLINGETKTTEVSVDVG